VADEPGDHTAPRLGHKLAGGRNGLKACGKHRAAALFNENENILGHKTLDSQTVRS
jgi:hypothetical protein